MSYTGQGGGRNSGRLGLAGRGHDGFEQVDSGNGGFEQAGSGRGAGSLGLTGRGRGVVMGRDGLGWSVMERAVVKL